MAGARAKQRTGKGPHFCGSEKQPLFSLALPPLSLFISSCCVCVGQVRVSCIGVDASVLAGACLRMCLFVVYVAQSRSFMYGSRATLVFFFFFPLVPCFAFLLGGKCFLSSCIALSSHPALSADVLRTIKTRD